MKTKKLVTTAMLIAIATILSVIKVFELPFGGTITPASMMPVILIGFIYGTKWGLFSAFVYSILQLFTGFGTVMAFFLPGDSRMALGAAITVCILDYFVAFTVLGLSGLFKKQKSTKGIILATVVTCVLRYIVHTVSGAIFFGTWAQWFFADSTGLSQIGFLKGFCTWVMQNVSGNMLSILYSVVYNFAYMLPETVFTVLVGSVIYKVIKNSNVL